jgi:hypothetical protein
MKEESSIKILISDQEEEVAVMMMMIKAHTENCDVRFFCTCVKFSQY